MNNEETTQHAQPVHQKPKRRWLTIILMIVIFIAGAAAGSGLTVICVVRHVKDMIANPNRAPDKIADAIKSKLSLSDEQDRQARQIVLRHHDALIKLRCQWQPQVVAELEKARNEISAVLNDDQRKKWNEHFERMRNTWLPELPKTDSATEPARECGDQK